MCFVYMKLVILSGRRFEFPRCVAAHSNNFFVRHPSLVRTRIADEPVGPILNPEDCKSEFVPLLRSGAWADMGSRGSMEDVYICADSFVHDYGGKNPVEGPGAFYARRFEFPQSKDVDEVVLSHLNENYSLLGGFGYE